MSKFRLLWAVFGNDRSFDNSIRGKKEDVTLDEVLKCLEDVLSCSGLLELIFIDPPDFGPRGLQIRAENGSAVISLAEINNSNEKKIRVYRSPVNGKSIQILEETWDSSLVCNDMNIIKEAISDLMLLGNVSDRLLS